MNKCQLFDFWEPSVKCIYVTGQKSEKKGSVLMNCLTLEKTLVPFPLCELDTKEKPIVPKGRCRKIWPRAQGVDSSTIKGVWIC